MKHLKLFEAFESSLLSNTLKFIKKDQITDFKNILSNICSLYDMPMSKLNDNMFEYLSYKKALLVNKEIIISDCNMESDWIKGEFCKNGRVKRTWGNGVRMTDCNYCGGSGKDTPKYDASKVKFWFNIDGKIVKTTISDGTSKKVDTLSGEFSRKVLDYEILDTITDFSKFELLSDCYIYVGSINDTKDIIGYIYRDSGTSYFLQDAYSTGPSPGIVNNISSKSLRVNDDMLRTYMRTEGNSGCILLRPKENTSTKVDITTPLLNDKESSITRYGLNSRGFISRDSLINAHFCIILDIDKLKGSDYKKKSEISSSRKDDKIDAYSLISNEDIKKANIERYISEIIKKSSIDADSGVKNIKSLVIRALGGINILYFIVGHSKVNDISRITSYLYDIVTKDDSNDLEYNIQRANSYISSTIKSTRDYLNKMNNKEVEMLDFAKSRDDNNVIDIHKDIKRLSKTIYDILNARDIETIEDMEILVQDIEYIRNLCTGSRISLNMINDYFLSILGDGWSSSNTYYKLYSQDFDKVKANINSITNIIERKLK